MKIAIIGGGLAEAIARLARIDGHDIGVQNPQALATAAFPLGSLREAIADTDLVIFTLPCFAAADVLTSRPPPLAIEIVCTSTDAVNDDGSPPTRQHASPGAEQNHAPARDAVVADAFDTRYAGVVAQVLRALATKAPDTKLPAPDGHIPHCLNQVEEYIQDHIGMPLSLSRLATRAGLSEGYFLKLFKASYQSTPHQYVLQLRIEKAKVLLTNSSHSIIDIGVICGFPNAQHFSRRFSRATGLSPSHYRRNTRHVRRKPAAEAPGRNKRPA